MRYRVIGLVASAAVAVSVLAQVSPKANRSANEMEPLIASLATYEFGQSREPTAAGKQFALRELSLIGTDLPSPH